MFQSLLMHLWMSLRSLSNPSIAKELNRFREKRIKSRDCQMFAIFMVTKAWCISLKIHAIIRHTWNMNFYQLSHNWNNNFAEYSCFPNWTFCKMSSFSDKVCLVFKDSNSIQIESLLELKIWQVCFTLPITNVSVSTHMFILNIEYMTFRLALFNVCYFEILFYPSLCVLL